MAKKKAKKKKKKKKTGPKPGMRMTPNRELFCQQVASYPKKCQTDIYHEIFTCSRTAAAMASSRLMAYDIIKNRIAEIQKPAMDKLEVTAERVFAELANIAFCDPAGIYDENGKVLPIHQIPVNVRRAISSIGRGGIKFCKKEKALELLGKTNFLNMFTEHIKVDEMPVNEEAIRQAAKDITKDIAKEVAEIQKKK